MFRSTQCWPSSTLMKSVVKTPPESIKNRVELSISETPSRVKCGKGSFLRALPGIQHCGFHIVQGVFFVSFCLKTGLSCLKSTSQIGFVDSNGVS